LGDCQRCKLCHAGRTNIVFGEGNSNADLVFVGEGPGYHEDRQARPFVGKAGELLDSMIGAMGLTREEVYICNVVKCRPPKNRDPDPDEVIACQPFLRAQIRSIQPKVIVAMGRFASQTLLNTADGINRLRGQFYGYFGTPLMPTFHPAYLLRNPADKGKVWSDLQLVMDELGLSKPQG
jgi:DNA polymerase